MKKVAVFLAHGTEEGEAIIQIDLLRRAGIEVKTFSIEEGLEITSAHDIIILADDHIDSIKPEEFDMLFVPGGAKGVERMYESKKLSEVLIDFAKTDSLMSAVCAAPTVLGKLGLLDGEVATCAPNWESGLGEATHKAESVVVSGKFITGQGLGASIPLALACIEALLNKDEADKVAKAICYKS